MEQQNSIRRLWELAEEEHGKLIGAIISAVAGVLSGIVPYIAGALIIVEMIGGTGEAAVYIKLCAVAMAGYAGKTVLYTLALSLSHEAAFAVLRSIRRRILAKLPRLPLGTILDTSSGKMKQIIVDHVESMETTLAHILPELTSNILGPVAVLVYIFVLDWRMGFISLIPVVIGFSCMGLTMRDYENDFKGAVKVGEEMNSAIVQYIGGIEVVKAFNQRKRSYRNLSDRVMANASYYYNWMKRCQLPQSLAFAIAPATTVAVLPLGWIFFRNGSLAIEDFVTIIVLAMSIVAPIIKAMSFGDSLAKITTIVSSVDAILQGREQQHAETPADIKSSDISLENVCFGYSDDKEILHDVSLDIPAGTLTAMVGPSGSGKSTIAKLIGGFWDAGKGSVKLGGTDERDIPLEQLYGQVAFVTQDNYLFDDTVMENLRMGNLSASDDEIIEAAKAAGCHDFIMKLEDGYSTMVGGGGTHLSGGERQRIAIARAILKDAPVIILDEATAYIDPENEAVIQRAVGNLVKDRTVIVIAHRLSTITGADKIVVVDDGRISAEGTHEELLRSSELYSSMWKAHMDVKEGEI